MMVAITSRIMVSRKTGIREVQRFKVAEVQSLGDYGNI